MNSYRSASVASLHPCAVALSAMGEHSSDFIGPMYPTQRDVDKRSQSIEDRVAVLIKPEQSLKAAARLYLAAGFVKTEEKPGWKWGAHVVEEKYELANL